MGSRIVREVAASDLGLGVQRLGARLGHARQRSGGAVFSLLTLPDAQLRAWFSLSGREEPD